MIAAPLGVMWERFNAKRQFQLGMSYLYLSGTVGTPENTQETLRLFHQSAKQGYAEAQFFLGMCYANGSGVPQNKKKALKWYRQAAEQGHERAKEFLDQLKNEPSLDRDSFRSSTERQEQHYENQHEVEDATSAPMPTERPSSTCRIKYRTEIIGTGDTTPSNHEAE